MPTDNVNFNTKQSKKEVTDKGYKDVKVNMGATPDQIGSMHDLQPTKYPNFEPFEDQDQGIVSDQYSDTYYPKGINPNYVNPSAPMPANQDRMFPMFNKIDQVKDQQAKDITYDAQNKWYQGKGNNTDQATAPFYIDFKGKGTTTEKMNGGAGPIAPQRSKKVWPVGIPERPVTPVDAAGYANTDGFIFNTAGSNAGLEAEAGGSADHAKLKRNVNKQPAPISGGPIGAARGPRAEFEFTMNKEAATPANKNPQVLSPERVSLVKPEPGMNDANPPTSYAVPVGTVKKPMCVVDEKAQKDRTFMDNSLTGVNTEFMASIGQPEGVEAEDTDLVGPEEKKTNI